MSKFVSGKIEGDRPCKDITIFTADDVSVFVLCHDGTQAFSRRQVIEMAKAIGITAEELTNSNMTIDDAIKEMMKQKY